MSNNTPDQSSPQPDTMGAIGQKRAQFPEDQDLTPTDEKTILEKYGRIRGYYRLNPDKYRDLQTWLNQARMGVSYDVYLARSAYYSVVAALSSALLGILLASILANAGLIEGIENPLTYSSSFTSYLGDNRSLFAAAFIAIASSALAAAVVWYARYLYPKSIVGSRARNIDVTLPHAITFMYALSYGGMDSLEVFNALGNAEDTYGEVANEFEMIARDVELFGNDLNTGLRNARNLTPSDNLESFLDDMLSVLDSGGDMTAFLEAQGEKYLETARDEQESFIESLDLYGELFIILFVASPLFFIVTLLVVSLLGGSTLGQLTLVVYAVLPLGMAGFLVLIDTLSTPYRVPQMEFESDRSIAGGTTLLFAVVRDSLEQLREVFGDSAPPTAEATHLRNYKREQRRKQLRKILTNPLPAFRRRPLWTLVVTVPIALGVMTVFVRTGTVQATRAAFLSAPIQTTTFLVAVPLLVVLVPMSLFHELKRRRDKRISLRFSDTLNTLSSANKMGVELTSALALVARWTKGPLGDEMRKVRNDIRWYFNTRESLLALASRLRTPRLSRSLKLVAEGTRSSSDIARVLSVAARDAREQYKLDQRRRSELSSYLAIVVIGFLVYLMVILVLDSSYLEPISQVGQAAPPPGSRGAPVSVSNVPVEAYRALFLHSALIQGFGIGLIAGKLVDDTLLSGLKYSIVMITITILTFALI